MTATGNITTTSNVTARTVTATGETYTGGWFRTRGDTGWYSEKWGGGIYQSDADYVRIYNNKGLATGGTLAGGRVVSSGTISATGRVSNPRGPVTPAMGSGQGRRLIARHGIW